ncbi:hypothetical protein SK128_027876, partial [Halocaridina rubra]
VALTQLDHSPQKGKASVGRSGALSNRRPPSRGSRSSRQSVADSLHLIHTQEELEDIVVPRVVNIEVQLESDTKKNNTEERKQSTKITNIIKGSSHSFREQLEEPVIYKQKAEEQYFSPKGFNANQEIRKKLFETRHRRSIGSSNPLLSITLEAEESFRRIKEEVARLAARRRSSSDISESGTQSDVYSHKSAPELQWRKALKKGNEERESLLETACPILEKGEENRSSSDADAIISDRESIADSGIVNRRTVIKIHEKKSKSATDLIAQSSTPSWSRDLHTRRSLRESKEEAPTRIIPVHIDPELEGGINVSIVNPSDIPRKDSTSRMYVRQSDSENRPSRASAFNIKLVHRAHHTGGRRETQLDQAGKGKEESSGSKGCRSAV